MNVEKFLKSKKWRLMGKWKEPLILGDAVTSSVVRPPAVIFDCLPSAYIMIGYKQFVPEADFQKDVSAVKKLLVSDPPNVVLKMKKQILNSVSRLNNFSVKELNAKNLNELFSLIRNQGRQWYEIMLVDEILQNFYPKSLPKSFLLGGEKYTSQSLLAKTALPKKIFPMIQERLDLLKIAIKAQKNDITKDFESHAKKYSWMASMVWQNEPFSIDYYQNLVEEKKKGNPKKELDVLQSERQKQHKLAEKLLAELKKSQPQAWLYIDIIRELADLKEENWDAVSIVGYRLRPLFRKVAASFYLSFDQFMMQTIEEADKTINSGELAVSVNELNQRLKHYGVIHSNQGDFILSGDDSIAALNLIEPIAPKTDVVEGTVIWQGKVQGKARVLFSIDDVPKMKQGEIMICPMSDPDYMPAIHKATAIVTDQGGVLCHAAIVARELQIPCVVGTGYATKIFKDGDLVEVDANQGIVRKIKK